MAYQITDYRFARDPFYSSQPKDGTSWGPQEGLQFEFKNASDLRDYLSASSSVLSTPDSASDRIYGLVLIALGDNIANEITRSYLLEKLRSLLLKKYITLRVTSDENTPVDPEYSVPNVSVVEVNHALNTALKGLDYSVSSMIRRRMVDALWPIDLLN